MGVACSSSQDILFHASSIGDNTLIENVMSRKGKNRAYVNTKGPDGYTALHFAAEAGHSSTVKDLIRRGAKLNTANDSGFTALSVAAKNGHDAVVCVLVTAGADLEQADTAFGCTALLWAVQGAGLETVRFLCDRGANKEARSTFGQTAIMYAAEAGALDIVKMLLMKGASPIAKDPRGGTALSRARSRGHKPIVDVIEAALRGVLPQERDFDPVYDESAPATDRGKKKSPRQDGEGKTSSGKAKSKAMDVKKDGTAVVTSPLDGDE